MSNSESNRDERDTELDLETREDLETHDEIKTHISRGTAETMRVTGEYAQIAPDMLRFGRGRYRTVEFLVKNPDHTFHIRSEDVHDIVIGRRDANLNYVPIIDLSDFGGKLFGVSRRHATLNNRNGLLYLTDHNTTNGTYVNGKRIEPEVPHVLTNGDRLQIGRVHMMIKFTDKVLAT
ncbi:MAG: FHA domain-containing protein [Phototrophicaceae bacterium]